MKYNAFHCKLHPFKSYIKFRLKFLSSFILRCMQRISVTTLSSPKKSALFNFTRVFFRFRNVTVKSYVSRCLWYCMFVCHYAWKLLVIALVLILRDFSCSRAASIVLPVFHYSKVIRNFLFHNFHEIFSFKLCLSDNNDVTWFSI